MTEKTESGVPLTMNAEVQFKGYSDGSRTGPCITFRLADAKMLDAWRGEEGQRYRLVAVKIGDDEEPQPPRSAAAPAPGPAVARAPAAPARRERMPPLCEWAVYRCDEAMFQRWAGLKARDMGVQAWPADTDWKKPQSVAKAVILVLAEVNSRKDIDASPRAAARFRQLVLQPYSTWLQAQEQDA